MKTTKEERAAWKQLPPTGEYVATRDVNRLIADVDEATRLLEQQHQHLAPNKKLPHSLCLICEFLFGETSDD